MDLAAIRKLELETLKRITQIGEFGRLGELQQAAREAIPTIGEYSGGVDVNLGFTLDIALRGDRKGRPVRRRLDLGALVVPSADKRGIQNASYSLIICKYASPSTSPVVRKVHFDYEPEALRNHSEPKPSHHLQICGKLSRHHQIAGYQDSRLGGLYPKWEKPRIPVAPTSIALMLNWLLLEFQGDPASLAVLRSTAWRSCVADAERIVLAPYFSRARAFLESTSNRPRRFLQAHLYGMNTE